jgi:hypothetical protein
VLEDNEVLTLLQELEQHEKELEAKLITTRAESTELKKKEKGQEQATSDRTPRRRQCLDRIFKQTLS